MAPATLVTAAPVVRVSDFAKRYGGRQAVEGASLEVAAGEIYGLIGPDGAGKSSLLKAVAGVLDFDAGSVEVLGVGLDSERAAERVKGRLGFMLQGLGGNLYPELTVEENVDVFAELRLVDRAALAKGKERLLTMTRLAAFRDRPMKHLSGGMKQKLGLVCTLIHRPELLVLDEPTTGVDPVSRRDFWAIVTELMRERPMTVLVATAYMDEASRFHRLAFMYGGRVLAHGRPAEVRALVKGLTVSFDAEAPPAALARLRTRFPQAHAMGERVRVLVPLTEADAALATVGDTLAGLSMAEATVTEPELDDVFVWLLRDEPGLVPATPPRHGAPPRVPTPEAAVIEARGLTRDFGGFRAVDGATFRVQAGQVFGLLGANGAGKTTVIKMLTGILPPTAGIGRVAGVDMRRPGHEVKRRIGYMSQAFSLYHDLTAVENVRLYAGLYGLSGAEVRHRTEWVLALGGLGGLEDTLTARLPMGMRQRLALGCALVHRPQAVFLDEPTSGVDPIGRRRFWEILFDLAREDGVAVLVTTHYMTEAEHCDHLALMFAGRIVADATPVELKRSVEAEGGADGRPLTMEDVFVHRVRELERAAGAAA